MKYAPIILFTYNRLYHTKLTIDALKKNDLADKSKLIVYSDAPKKSTDKAKVEEVRNYIKSIQGFKEIEIVKREQNFGLAENIIQGVKDVINKYGKVIVLEDDIVTSTSFLKYMNTALNFYEDRKEVWHISGWNYPIKTDGLGDVFFSRIMNCWGWGTWKNRWSKFKISRNTDLSAINKKAFNLDGYLNSAKQIKLNNEGVIKTWAIFWYLTIFNNNGLCLNPKISYTNNIGMDGTGENCKITNRLKNELLNDLGELDLEMEITENKIAIDRIKKVLEPNYFRRIIKKIR